MSAFRNPLARFRGPELKEPLFVKRAMLGKRVRKILLEHPEGLTRTELNERIEGAGNVCEYLRKSGFARMSPSNAKINGTRGELWFASEPPAIKMDEPPQ